MENLHFIKQAGSAGFTMIEMVTVLGIIVIMSVITFANYHSGNQQYVLENEAYLLAQNFRKVQEMALSSRDIPGVNAFGYGIYLKQGDAGYKLYADLTDPPDGVYQASDYTVLDVAMAKNVYFVSVTPDILSVNYTPPDPLTTLTGSTGQAVEATIVLGMEGVTKTQTVIVNRGGLIYVQ